MEASLVIFLLLVLYFLPTAVAAARRARRTGAILALNLLLGWTLLGWVAALVWSLADDADAKRRSAVADFFDPEPMPDTATRLPCPHCAEAILPSAEICRFCGSRLAPGWASA